MGFLVGGDTAVGWCSRRLGKGGQLSLGAGGDIGIKQDVGVEKKRIGLNLPLLALALVLIESSL